MERDITLCNRRSFLVKGIGISLIAGSASAFLGSCKDAEGEEKEVSPPEDLMQEHGLLNRILLIYDHCKLRLLNKQDCDLSSLHISAGIIRQFVEDYHEKQEEDYLFPRFEKANTLIALVSTLRKQHNAGRNITAQIMELAKAKNAGETEKQRLIGLLDKFNIMYRPHEAREDTVLFPAFRKIVSKHEYDSLGEEFEKNEHKLFGEDGFQTMVMKVEEIEKNIGIYELEQFTPGN
ncbi:MAG: hemerythrin domain-containing protein [Bacteroidia bacterium]